MYHNDDDNAKAKLAYVAFGPPDGLAGERSAGVGLQQDHGVPLALPLLAGPPAAHVGLDHQRRPPLLLVPVMHLAGAHAGLHPGQAHLDLEDHTVGGRGLTLPPDVWVFFSDLL